MSDPKPFASLGATLLARKGGAKPAMRPQASRVPTMNGSAAAQNLEDLGWDDMGEEDAAADHSAEVLQLTPAPHNPEAEALTDRASPKPKVLTMHEELALRVAEEEQKKMPKAAKVQALPPLDEIEVEFDDEPEPMPVFPHARLVVDSAPATSKSKGKPEAANDSRRAAFTLRLDAKRHLKLRLASTVRGRSAQQIVTEALDRFLKDLPEIDSLASQVRRD
ncbi:hypothetical protein GRI89_15650 [Altererythrobacter salegens]|uniref:Uncharacterized protein n=1 Tax=Croceibacterium salegens TaxID=1737568 RepID=A0A6I4T116_9SPHN|nr:hypothetical protein [Croceibacterium salegens]MXO60976.1 hypothetical protein [Croceibacterium salegens]